MSLSKPVDYGTLNWVKAEIDETLKQARHTLESFAANPKDNAQMRFCVQHLHQVRGTLQMIELYGAALLAEEMEGLAAALLNEQVARQDDVFEVLMRAILQLPDYLERLQTGHADYPIILLPLLNDLRAARGQKLMSEGALFAPDFDMTKPPPRASGKAQGKAVDIRVAARKLRPAFQLGLVNWHRDNSARAPLQQMAKVVNHLDAVSSTNELAQLWCASAGVLEGLLEDGLQPNVSIELLMGQVERQLKRLIDLGEAEWVADPPRELIKNLLYYVARARPVGARIVELKRAFDLDKLLPGEQQLAQASADLAAPNLDLMRTVSAVIKEDLAKVKDGLDTFVRSENRALADLQQLDAILHQTADTLGVLGLGTARQAIQDQLSTIQDIEQGKILPGDSTLMDMASALLEVEASLDDLVAMQGRAEAPPDAELGSTPEVRSSTDAPASSDNADESLLSDVEYRQLLNAVVKEAKADMARVKDAIMGFITVPMQHSLLADVPQWLAQIIGGFTMLSEARAAAVLQACKDRIVAELIGAQRIPDQGELDTLAEVISGVEYYLEALNEDRTDRGEILDLAEARIAQLDFGHTRFEAPPASDGIEIDFPISSPVADGTSAAAAAPGHVQHEAAHEAVQTPPLFNSVSVSRPDEIDEEIIGIFLEEAGEELVSIALQLPRWKNNPDDREALTTVRRSFHTLKGSGRMVGATVIGEFAWAFESMLNRVIDRTVQVRPEMFDLLEQAQAALPQLIEHFKDGAPPPSDLAALMEQAAALSQGGMYGAKPVPPRATPPADGAAPHDTPVVIQVAAPLTDTTPVAEHAAPAEVTAPYSEAATGVPHGAPLSPRIDPVLLDIFTRETAGHLAAIEKFIEQCRHAPDECRVSEALVRTLHTLHGSASMAEVTELAEPSGLLEKYAKRLSLYQTVLAPEVKDMLRASVAFVRDTLRALADPAVAAPDGAGLTALITRLYEAELNAQPDLAVEQPKTVAHGSGHGATDAAPDRDSELVDIFLDEAREILDAVELILQQWISARDNTKLLEELQRELHTLKGGARMAGITPIGDLSHHFETMITALVEGQITLSPRLPELMQQAQDRLLQMLDHIFIHLPVLPADDLIAAIHELINTSALRPGASNVVPFEPSPKGRKDSLGEEQHTAAQGDSEQEQAGPGQGDVAAGGEDITPWMEEVEARREERGKLRQEQGDDSDEQSDDDDRRVSLRPQHEQIRVRADLLDNLVNFAAEISISRSRIEQQIGAFKFNLVEIDQIVARLRGQLRKLEIETEAQILFRYAEAASHEEEFDPLELDRFSQIQQLSRSLLESASDLASIEGLLQNLTREAETLLVQQARVNTDLHEGLMRARMVQFAVLMPRLRRVVRQTCQELGKQVELRVLGAEGEMDRTVLDRITPSLEHMLRNAIDHGMESLDARRAAGKAEQGAVTIRLEREGSEMVMHVSDDGAGLNLEAIRAKAIERGLLARDADVTDNEAMQFILEPGFSTARQVTQISGRGVGMDVVNNEIKQLGGSLRIDSNAGQGTTFIVRLPLTLSINRALLVQVGEELYAVPLTSIERIMQIAHAELEQCYAAPEPTYGVGEQSYRVLHLSAALGAERPALSAAKKKFPLLLVRIGDHRFALQADSLLGSREIVVKSVGPQISAIRGITGATILGDGRVVLILDVNALVRAGVSAGASIKEILAPSPPRPDVITVMVVDDSITVRKVTSRLLERHAMQVLSAKDGIDAVALLQDHIPDVMLLDIEMPRMDGYELATHIRNEARLKHIPIIMITSRTGEKHRERAMQIGVNRYMGKPYQEGELLENIFALLGEHSAAHH